MLAWGGQWGWAGGVGRRGGSGVGWHRRRCHASRSARIPPTPPCRQTLQSSNIAWQYDAKHLYADAPPQNFNDDPATRGGNTSAVGIASNQHLMVWLRPAASPSFRKLYGVLGTALPAGSTVRIAVLNRYNTYGFNGHKAVVLSTDSWAGGRNHFLGAAFLATAALCLLTAAAFGAAAAGGCGPAARRRKFGDPAELSWNRRPA